MNPAKTPCQIGDPENWFIEDDGKQYPDDVVVTADEMTAIVAEAAAEGKVDDALDRVEALMDERKQAALKRRRHAIDACHVDCRARVQCLTVGLEDENLQYGVYGGYTAKQRREVVRLREERRTATEGSVDG